MNVPAIDTAKVLAFPPTHPKVSAYTEKKRELLRQCASARLAIALADSVRFDALRKLIRLQDALLELRRQP